MVVREAARKLVSALDGTPLAAGLKLDVPLSSYVSFRIGGPADALAETSDPSEIRLLLAAARDARVASLVLGLGTNLLVRDGGFRGLVVRIVPPPGGPSWQDDPPAVVAGAGVALADLSSEAADRGMSGLEFAEGIPGTVGGAVVMNAGAYGGEIGTLVEWVEVLKAPGPEDAAGAASGTDRWTREQLGFGYRKSALQDGGRYIVTRVKLALGRGDAAAVRAKTKEYAERRRTRQPLEYPSAGSFFVRPPGRYAGPMIEQCGLKGFRVGDAMVSPKHANFIVNLGNATARDVLAVAGHVQETVYDQFGVWLEPEVRIIGEE